MLEEDFIRCPEGSHECIPSVEYLKLYREMQIIIFKVLFHLPLFPFSFINSVCLKSALGVFLIYNKFLLLASHFSLSKKQNLILHLLKQTPRVRILMSPKHHRERIIKRIIISLIYPIWGFHLLNFGVPLLHFRRAQTTRKKRCESKRKPEIIQRHGLYYLKFKS